MEQWKTNILTLDNGKPTMDYGKPTMDYGKLTFYNRKPTLDNGNQQWTMENWH